MDPWTYVNEFISQNSGRFDPRLTDEFHSYLFRK